MISALGMDDSGGWGNWGGGKGRGEELGVNLVSGIVGSTV